MNIKTKKGKRDNFSRLSIKFVLVEMKVFLLILLFAIAYRVYADCPNGTFSNVAGDECYFIPNSTTEFVLAEINCKKQSGDLASISNAFDNMALTGKKGLPYAQRCLLRRTFHDAMLQGAPKKVQDKVKILKNFASRLISLSASKRVTYLEALMFYPWSIG